MKRTCPKIILATIVFSFFTISCLCAQTVRVYTPGKSISEYDRGNGSVGDVVSKHKQDHQYIMDMYGDNPGNHDCRLRRVVNKAALGVAMSGGNVYDMAEIPPGSLPKKIKQVKHGDPVCVLRHDYQIESGTYDIPYCTLWALANGMPEVFPYYDYFVPFQQVETAETSYNTAYLTEDLVGGFLSKSQEVLYGSNFKQNALALFRHVVNAGVSNDWGLENTLLDGAAGKFNKVIDQFQPTLEEFSLLRQRFRGSVGISGGRYVEMHVTPTYFDTNDGHKNQFKKEWFHQGALWSWVPVKNPVGYWFSEFPESILITRFSNMARTIPDIANQMIAPSEPDNCLKTRMEFHGLKSIFSGDSELSKLQRGSESANSDDKCNPFFYGVKYPAPLNYDKGTQYFTQAGTHGDWRGLQLANILGESGNRIVKNWIEGQGKPPMIHEFREVHEQKSFSEGTYLYTRDMWGSMDRRDKAFKGCWHYGGHYLPQITGNRNRKTMHYKEGNENEEGERLTGLHMRYVRACPVCYTLNGGNPPVILK